MDSFRYEKPGDLAGIVEFLGGDAGPISLLAGGTDLMIQLRSRLLKPALVLDVKGVEELRRLEVNEEGLSIGAAVILNRLLEEEAAAPYRALVEAVGVLASYALRNRATLVGNVANASPCADTVPPLCVFDAVAEIAGGAGSRRVPVQKLITGNRETALDPGEFITRIIVPPLPVGTWSGFRKRKRVRGHDLALASVALLRDPAARRLRMSVGSCTPVPVKVDLDQMYDAPDIPRAVELAQAMINPIDDVRASIEYRREMVGVMVRRLFEEMQAAVDAPAPN